MANIFSERVDAIRQLMSRKGWDAVIITGSDPHSSEYLAPRWKQVEWATGFTGETGDVVITADHAGLWTDTRYFIQANKQLAGTGVELHKTRVPDQVLIPEWLATKAFADSTKPVVIAVDGLCQGVSAIAAIKDAFADAGREEGSEEEFGYRIVSVPDMLEDLWEGRPAVPQTPIITLGEDIVGEGRWSKIEWLRGVIAKKGCDSMLVTALDDVAWLLNVRGSDIDFNPLVISYVLVTGEEVFWCVKKDNDIDADTRDSFNELRADGISIIPYDDIAMVLAGQIDEDLIGKLYVDPSTLNYNLYSILCTNAPAGSIVEAESPIQLRKAIKNPVEIEGMTDVHIEDGIAMEKFYYWLENRIADGIPTSEWDASMRLDEFRAEIPGYRGNSFDTISAYGEGAALPHYVTPHQNAPMLEPHGLYLCDSGGQYLNGTTDITRTVPLGPCTMLEKEDYTLVLKCHIGLEMAVFPRGTTGCHLDILGRDALWKARRNFGHGTGHGVGFYLGVHEGPQEFRQNFTKTPFVPGMINTAEPGIYREGMHGVRHENVMLVVADSVNEFGEWFRFESLTMCHIDTSAVIVDMLTADERKWLNDYNACVYKTLAPKLPQEVAEWLEDKCRAI